MADEKYDNNTHKYNSQIVLLFPTMYFHVGSPYRHRHLSTVTLFDILIDLEIRIFEMTNNHNHPLFYSTIAFQVFKIVNSEKIEYEIVHSENY